MMRTPRGRVATNSAYQHFGMQNKNETNKPGTVDLFGKESG